jgi:hypothetical protein
MRNKRGERRRRYRAKPKVIRRKSANRSRKGKNTGEAGKNDAMSCKPSLLLVARLDPAHCAPALLTYTSQATNNRATLLVPEDVDPKILARLAVQELQNSVLL